MARQPPAGGAAAASLEDADAAAPVEPQAAHPRRGLPRNVRLGVVGARLGYAVANAALLAWLWSLPTTTLAADGGVAFALVFWVTLTAVSFLTVQGSDPGYVDDDVLNEAEARARHAAAEGGAIGMMADMVDDASDDEDDDDRLGGRPVAAAAAATPSATTAAEDEDAEIERLVDEEMARKHGGPAEWLDEEEREKAGPGKPAHPGLPVRAHFCRVSGRYVHRFDHYCGFLATPIGERNHCRFYVFLLLQTATIVTATAITHTGLVYTKTAAEWFGSNGSALFLLIVLYMLLAFVGGLFLLHTWMAATGSTSYELLKGPTSVWYLRHTRVCDYPFSTGLLDNITLFCCVQDGLCHAIYNRRWRPRPYKTPTKVVRDSDDVIEHCWENKYWSCC